MNSHFKDSLNKVKADEELVYKTEQYLNNKLLNRQNDNLIQKIMHWRINKSVINIRKFAISTCIALLLIVGGAKVYATPQSYVNIDINPSVGLGINLFGLVTTMEAYNEDGYTILDGVHVTGKNVMDAVNILVNSAVNHGFIADDGSTVVTITAETNNEDTVRELNEGAEAGAQEALKENGKSAEIFKCKVDLAYRVEAIQIGITPGKLNLIRKLQAIDTNASMEHHDAGVDKQNDNAAAENINPTASVGNQNMNYGKGNQNSDAKNENNNVIVSQEKVDKDNSLKSQNPNDEEGYQKETSPIKDENSNTGTSNGNSNAEKGNTDSEIGNSDGNSNAEKGNTDSETGNSNGNSNAGQGGQHKEK